MKRSLLVIAVAACAAPKPLVTPSCPPLPPPPAAPAAPTKLDEATIKQKSHDLFDAYDRADVATFADLTGPTFGLYEEQELKDRDRVLANLKHRSERHAPIHSRTWGDEHVVADPYVALFFGEATEHVPPDGAQAAIDDDGANTLVWVHEGNRWVAASWTWARAGIQAERDRWNHELSEGTAFNHKPNQTLVDAVKGRKPGTALDIFMGQGRNAVFLATQGWKVTGVDISDAGIAIAREDAAKQHVKLDTVQSDIAKYDLGKDRWDLVTMIYAGDDLKLVERIKPAVKKGGLFVTEYFAADSDVAKSAGGWDLAALQAAFKDGWKILRADHVEDMPDWVRQHETKLVRFVAQKL